jgi:hypothetical protein
VTLLGSTPSQRKAQLQRTFFDAMVAAGGGEQAHLQGMGGIGGDGVQQRGTCMPGLLASIQFRPRCRTGPLGSPQSDWLGIKDGHEFDARFALSCFFSSTLVWQHWSYQPQRLRSIAGWGQAAHQAAMASS